MTASTGIVDADFWPQRLHMTMLAPYFDRVWREHLRIDNPLPLARPFDFPEGGVRTLGPAQAPPTPDADAHEVATTYLDRESVSFAILNPGVAGPMSAASNDQLLEQLSRATNDWLVGEWLERDSRFRGSIVVSVSNARLAAAEIRRLGHDPRIVQVIVAHPARLLGDRTLFPLYEAALECGLVLNLQAGGAWTGGNRGVFATGFPNSPYEEYLAWGSAAVPHLLSLISRGVFDLFPDLRVVLSGFGAAWLPPLLWRMDLECAAGRLGLAKPLTRLPSEIVRDHVKLTTQPLEIPHDPAQLADILGSIDGEHLLVHGTGAPMWRESSHGQAPLEALPGAWRDSIVRDNATTLYRLDQVLAAS